MIEDFDFDFDDYKADLTGKRELYQKLLEKGKST
jgi:hypothetical protein